MGFRGSCRDIFSIAMQIFFFKKKLQQPPPKMLLSFFLRPLPKVLAWRQGKNKNVLISL